MKHEKTVEQTYQILDEISHVLNRLAIYAGSPKRQPFDAFVLENQKFVKKQLNVIPAFVKIYSEIVDNVVDEHKRSPDDLTTAKININTMTGEISIEDNGRGIPVVKHSELGIYIPEMIFTNLRSGSNFSDVNNSGEDSDQSIIGVNGLGSKLTNICSEYFVIETADGKNSFKMECTGNMRNKSEPIIHKSLRKFTRITFMPDYKYFGMDGIDEDHLAIMTKRVIDCAACNPNMDFYINGKLIKIDSFEDYIKMYSDEYVYEESKDWKVGVTSSVDGFEQVSFVNGVETFQGGTHIDYISNQIVVKIREFLQKKHKVDVKPADIKTHFRVFISCNINRPTFSSQNKEHLTSPVSEWKTSHTISDKFVKEIVKSDIIQSILDWAAAKQQAAELAELRKKNKESDKVLLKKIPKFHDATTKDRTDAMLFLAEGDSASTPLLGARNPYTMGVFPLKGRPINVSASTLAKIRENAEFENIRNILGLRYGEKADPKKMNFGKVVISADFDSFGHSISGLIINLFYRMWPEIVEHGMLYRLITPVVVAKSGKTEFEFFSLAEFDAWREKNPDKKVTYRYLKGLGSNDSKMFKKYLDNPDKYMVKFTLEDSEDKDLLDLCFLKDRGFTDKRKEWLDIEAKLS